jgi:hypothetical protein
MSRTDQANDKADMLVHAATVVDADATLLAEIEKWRGRLLWRAKLADAEEAEPVVGGKIVVTGYGTQHNRKEVVTLVRVTKTQAVLRFGENTTEYRFNLKFGREAGRGMDYTGWKIPKPTLEKLRALAPRSGPKVPEADANRE